MNSLNVIYNFFFFEIDIIIVQRFSSRNANTQETELETFVKMQKMRAIYKIGVESGAIAIITIER